MIRDVIIISAISFGEGFVKGFGETVSGRKLLPAADIGISILLLIVCFTIIGCIVKVNRFKHLFLVALGLCVIDLIMIPFGFINPSIGFLSIFYDPITMALGGALSYIFVRIPRTVEQAAEAEFKQRKEKIRLHCNGFESN